MPNNNLAYNLDRYEDVTPEAVKTKIRVRRRKNESVGSAPMIIVTAVLAAFLLGLVIYGKVEMASLHAEIAGANRTVDELKSENVRMQTEIEGRTSMKSVESYAENILGMHKLEKSQIEYISIDNGNMAEIPDEEESVFIRIKNAFNDFIEYIKG